MLTDIKGGFVKGDAEQGGCANESYTRVVVGELDVVPTPRRKDLSVLQPDDMRLGDALRAAGQHRTATWWPRHRLRPLQELRGGWGDEHRVPANRGDALVHNVIRQTGLSKATCSAFRNMLFRGGDDAYCTRTHVRLQRF